ncbi:MAG: Uma2 family endonuclease, partial [Cyanobacteria bacterium J06635_15]
RFFDPQGQLVPTPEETAHQAQQRSERLAQKLRELGVDPDTV